MFRRAITVLALITAGAAWAGSPNVPAAGQTPLVFIRAVYHQFIIHNDQMAEPYNGPSESLYSPRMKGLVAKARDDTPEGDVPCGLDFVFWVDGQDYDIKSADITEQPGPDADTDFIIAKFISLREPHELHFTFKKIAGRWWMDDVESVIGTKWLWSDELNC